MTSGDLARALGDADPEVRRRAVISARALRSSEIAQFLLAALGDRDFRVRLEAIDAVSEQAVDLDLIPQLVEALADGEQVARRNAAREVLRNVGSAAVGTLVASLAEANSSTRRFVVEALACSSAQAALPALVSAARGADATLAVAAMDALSQLGGEQVERVLRECLRDGGTLLRTAALDALVRLRARVPYDELAPLLEERVLRRVAVDALAYCGDARAVRPLTAALEDKSVTMATRAASALARLAQPTSPAKAAVVVAMRQASSSARARLGALVEHDDPDVVAAATSLLALAQAAATSSVAPAGKGARLSHDAYQRLRELVNHAAGIVLGEDTRAVVERKLEPRMAALRLSSFDEYVRFLRQPVVGAAELEAALELLATHETYLFRDLPQLHAFEHEVLPELAQRASRRRTLTVWSAGCSTGEEAYTLAILITRSGLFRGWDVRIIGSDLSAAVLAVARRGVYRDASFRALPPEYEGHFRSTSDGRAVSDELKALCRFERRNLLSVTATPAFGMVDAVFCRNVLIYFDQVSRRRVVQSFYDALHPGGYLMLGHSESLLHMSTAFELAQLRGDLGYRKPLEGAP